MIAFINGTINGLWIGSHVKHNHMANSGNSFDLNQTQTYEFLSHFLKCVRLLEFALLLLKLFDVILDLLVLLELAADVLHELREEALVLAVGRTAGVDASSLWTVGEGGNDLVIKISREFGSMVKIGFKLDLNDLNDCISLNVQSEWHL